MDERSMKPSSRRKHAVNGIRIVRRCEAFAGDVRVL